jgi:hypothetical protein
MTGRRRRRAGVLVRRRPRSYIRDNGRAISYNTLSHAVLRTGWLRLALYGLPGKLLLLPLHAQPIRCSHLCLRRVNVLTVGQIILLNQTGVLNGRRKRFAMERALRGGDGTSDTWSGANMTYFIGSCIVSYTFLLWNT